MKVRYSNLCFTREGVMVGEEQRPFTQEMRLITSGYVIFSAKNNIIQHKILNFKLQIQRL
jgi:hypothetical protein